MTSGGNNFNDFPEIELSNFRAVWTILRQIGTIRVLLFKARLFLITSVNMNSLNTDSCSQFNFIQTCGYHSNTGLVKFQHRWNGNRRGVAHKSAITRSLSNLMSRCMLRATNPFNRSSAVVLRKSLDDAELRRNVHLCTSSQAKVDIIIICNRIVMAGNVSPSHMRNASTAFFGLLRN